MSIEWEKIRAWNGSQEKAFEELVCQLASQEIYPEGSNFIRKGTPDAGVECYWTLANSDEHAWQAKYFLSVPTTKQWAQIDDSVETALSAHPKLTRYTVCLPIDFPDGRQTDKKSMLQKWNERVIKWVKLAKKRKMSVQFEYWGDHQLTSRLNREENRGRHWFWFNKTAMTLAWFQEQLTIAIANAGERYLPPLHIELPISKYLKSMGRTPTFFQTVNSHYQALLEQARHLNYLGTTPELKENSEKCIAALAATRAVFDKILVPGLQSEKSPVMVPIDWTRLKEVTRALRDQNLTLERSLSSLIQKRESEKPVQANVSPAQEFRNQLYDQRRLSYACEAIIDYCQDKEAILSNNPALLIVGEAGQGKTHLLCDVANSDMGSGLPRLLLHGSHFVDGEPWAQVVRLLGLDCSSEVFLCALESAAQAFGCRILIFIDALNEGEGCVLWEKHLAGMLTLIANRPWIGIAISLRSTYEELIIPGGLVPDRLTKIEHQGFQEHEYEAVKRFFAFYKIHPTFPLLVPEFSNPLFLKLFCQGVKGNGWSSVPLGIRGISAIIEMLLNAVNDKLSRPEHVNYDKSSNLVKKAIDVVVQLMASTSKRFLPRESVLQAVNGIMNRPVGYDKSLFRCMVVEGILSESSKKGNNGFEHSVAFAYDRFADHLVAKYLLDRHLNRKAPAKSFQLKKPLGTILQNELESWKQAGLIEALAIQVPEYIGKELVELAPRARNWSTLQRAFLKSLVWRSTEAFSETTNTELNKYLRNRSARRDILDALVTVAPIPAHPFNSNRLHSWLMRHSLPNRDAMWTTFLHEEWSSSRSVRRLIDWNWNEFNSSSLPENVLVLCGTALAWFLTSSNRFLRDGATKALVKMFVNRLAELDKLLAKFWKVDDPYVIERLLASACGSVLRSTKFTGLSEIAKSIGNEVFTKKGLTPHLLTRDYARSIVEFAYRKGMIDKAGYDIAQPPYKSSWPSFRIPSESHLEKWGKWWEKMPKDQWAQHEIYSSVTGSGLSDFSNYVIGDLDEWTKVKLSESPPKSLKLKVQEFVDSLTEEQRNLYELYAKAIENSKTAFFQEFSRRFSAPNKSKRSSATSFKLGSVVKSSEDNFLASLTKPRQRTFFTSMVNKYLDNSHTASKMPAVDGKLMRRWMVKRIIDLGWNHKLHGEFDWVIHSIHNDGRDAGKPERIGKKYQWIAYHELLARLSDNFYIKKDRYREEEGVKAYSGPWDLRLGFVRDIDPTIVIKRTQKNDKLAGRCWWSRQDYKAFDGLSTATWVKRSDDLPKLEDMVTVHSDDKKEWLVLDMHQEWKESARPGDKEYDQALKNLWYIIRSYLVRRKDATAFQKWAFRQSFFGNWMPEGGELHGIFHGEYAWAPSFKNISHDLDCVTWVRKENRSRLPVEVALTCVDIGIEANSFDCSVEETSNVNLPSPFLADAMNLSWAGIEGQFNDSSGNLAALDPSVYEAGPGALLVRKDLLTQFLEDNELEIFWTLLGEKNITGTMIANNHSWLQVNGVYRLKDGTIVGKHTTEFQPKQE